VGCANSINAVVRLRRGFSDEPSLRTPQAPLPEVSVLGRSGTVADVHRRDRLGGLIGEYYQAAT